MTPNEAKAEWRRNNPDKVKEIQRRHYAKNWSPGSPGREKYLQAMKEYHYQRKYGITLADKEIKVQECGGMCEMCGMTLTTSTNTHLDHDHVTGRVRGILCGSCNRRLGWYELHADQVQRYLTKYGVTQE
jgi:hypothetical protein